MSDVQPPSTTFASEGDGAQMGFFDHLGELRDRMLRVVIFLVIALIAMSFFTEPLLIYLLSPCEAPEGAVCQLQVLSPTGTIVAYFRVALMSAAILVVPYATYQLMMFILPGLTDKERRIVLTAIPVTTLLFLCGVAFAWFILVPAALPFLQNFLGDVFEPEWTADEYIAFLTALLFWMGVAFEMPVIFFVLARLGIIGPGLLMRNWRLAVVLITIAAALITPTVDPFNMLLVVAPLLVLYVISIFLTAIAYRARTGVTDAP